MSGVFKEPSSRKRLKYLATINDEALAEDTDPDFELQYLDIGNVDSAGNIDQPVTFIFELAPSRARRIVKDGDVILSTVRTYLQAIAPIHNPPDNLIVSTGFAVIRPKSNVLFPGFCKYALRDHSFLAEVVKRSVGVSYPAINASEVGDIDISFLPLAVQKQVADFLDRETSRIDTLIAEKVKLLELLAEKRRALISNAATRGLDPAAPRRDSGIPWLGFIPKHWSTCRNAFLFHERDQRGEPELPLLEVSINQGVIIREFSDDKIEGTAADFNTYKVAKKGDIVFNKMRMWQGAVGVAPVDGLTSPDYTVAEPSGVMTAEYANALFRTAIFSAECARHSNGIVWDRLRLYWEGFRDIWVPLPPPGDQRAILSYIDTETTKLDKLRSAAERTIVLLKERRAALIAAAVTGQLNIS